MVEIIGFVTIVITILTLSWAWRRSAEERSSARNKIPTLMGLLNIAVGFFVLPWIRISPIHYLLDSGPVDLLPDAMQFFGYVLEDVFEFASWLGPIGSFLEGFGFSGVFTWLLLAPDPARNWFVRLVILLPLLVFILFTLWLVADTLLRQSGKLRGKSQAITAVTVIGLLVTQIPAIDAWGIYGTSNQINFGLVTWVTGLAVGWGVWVTIWGLCLLMIGGLNEIHQYQPSENGPINSREIEEFERFSRNL